MIHLKDAELPYICGQSQSLPRHRAEDSLTEGSRVWCGPVDKYNLASFRRDQFVENEQKRISNFLKNLFSLSTPSHIRTLFQLHSYFHINVSRSCRITDPPQLFEYPLCGSPLLHSIVWFPICSALCCENEREERRREEISR